MSYQILEEARDAKIHLVGLNKRGVAVAQILKTHIEEAIGEKVQLDRLDEQSDNDFSFSRPVSSNQVLVIIDDVIFSGRTMFHAIQKIPERSAFQKIFISVLADRGHRKFPLLAGVVGLHVPTKLNEHVELKLDDGEPSELLLIKK